MRLTMMRSKVHRVTVTAADLEYEGSFTLDVEIMEAAGLLPHERIDVLDVTNGSRLTTYVIPGERGSRIAQANGAAAHLVRKGDIVILVSWAEMEPHEAKSHVPTVVLVGAENAIAEIKSAAPA